MYRACKLKKPGAGRVTLITVSEFMVSRGKKGSIAYRNERVCCFVPERHG